MVKIATFSSNFVSYRIDWLNWYISRIYTNIP